ncbi:hypothetical protein CMUS01_07275 [Colletotrichum musicola]|uniref:Uncharacterized protein n=1 Tax=Colletotrichum musicola TaxID=2175873 RepID=A0A8H6NGC3_9PEZI|nr:hypothetical protein CMUS01_07275 [Colletotrichum musicola]
MFFPSVLSSVILGLVLYATVTLASPNVQPVTDVQERTNMVAYEKMLEARARAAKKGRPKLPPVPLGRAAKKGKKKPNK